MRGVHVDSPTRTLQVTALMVSLLAVEFVHECFTIFTFSLQFAVRGGFFYCGEGLKFEAPAECLQTLARF